MFELAVHKIYDNNPKTLQLRLIDNQVVTLSDIFGC